LEEDDIDYSISQNDRTPLQLSCEMGSYMCAKLLLKRDGDLNVATKKGVFPIHFATASGNAKLVKLLKENNFDIAIKEENEDSNTPLHIAAQKKFSRGSKIFA